MAKRYADFEEAKKKPAKFNFDEAKIAATHESLAVRKQAFIEYFERFAEFPTYFFNNEHGLDKRLQETIDGLLSDPDTTTELRAGIDAVCKRLSVA
ncbi:MAG: hypothetical protein JO019_01940 [Candidatus Kaiserbacteria bacterium]|nr:hypothetical protein [Candidatus Kaiserbacteria bacterium]